MMDEFLAALAPEPFRVFGRELRPLSFGHVVLLNRLGIDPVTTTEDLFAAVQICRRSYAEGLAYVRELMTAIGQARLESEVEQCQNLNMPAAFQAWGDYIQENSQCPTYCQGDGPKSERGAPMLAQIREVLMGQCNYSPAYVLDAPYGQCLWDYGCALESSMGWGIVGDRHKELASLLEARN